MTSSAGVALGAALPPGAGAQSAPVEGHPSPAGRRPRRDLWRGPYLALLCGIVGFGAALRIRQWVHGRSLWLDEASLVQNLDARNGMDLTRPLENGQIAPHGWLWLVDLTDRAGLADERALRAVPLVLGCATLVVVAGLAAVVLRSRLAVLLTVALAAISPWLIGYSNDVKQYSADTFAVTTLLLATVLAARAPDHARRLALWALAVAVGVWISQAAVIVAPALGALLLVAAARRGRRPALTLLALATPAAISLLVELRLLLANTAASPGLDRFWRRAYPPDPLGWDGFAEWLGRTGTAFSRNPLSMAPAQLVLGMAVAGFAVVAVRRDLLTAVILATPAGVAVLGGLLRVYPPSGRLVLFVVPAMLVLVAAALDGAIGLAGWLLGRGSAGPGRRIPLPARLAARLAAPLLPLGALTLALLVAWPAAGRVPGTLMRGADQEELASAFAAVAEARAPGDAVVLSSALRQFARVYGPRYQMTDAGLLTARPKGERCDPDVLPWQLRDHSRVWLIGGHLWRHEQAILAVLGRNGQVARAERWRRARVVLVEMTPRRPRDAGQVALPTTGSSCLLFRPVPPLR